MNIMELHKFLNQWTKLNSYPSYSGWPDKLSLPTAVWKDFENIMKYTRGDGHEYAVSLFYIDNEIFVTPHTRGTRENVVTRESIQVRYEPKDKNYYEKKIFSGDKLIHKNTISIEKVPKQIDINYLFNVHTHPIQKDEYSFFSDTDIRTFLFSNAIVMGLLTDRLWLVCKTDKSLKVLGENGENILYEISRRIFEGSGNAEELIKTLLLNWGLVFYVGEVNQFIRKV